MRYRGMKAGAIVVAAVTGSVVTVRKQRGGRGVAERE